MVVESRHLITWESRPLSSDRDRLLRLVGLPCLIVILAAELVFSIRQQSPTWNEAYHLVAGYRYWQCSDFGVNPEHPPLVKLLASAPLLGLHLRVPAVPTGSSKQEWNVAGRKLLYANDADTLLFRARLAVGLLVLVLALLLWEAGSRMFGPRVALLALVLAAFEPNILAHGALVTTDLGLTCGLFAAVYAFYRFVRWPSVLCLVECGLTVGIALAVKHSGLLVFPILGSLALAELVSGVQPISEGGGTPPRELKSTVQRAFRLIGALVVVGAIALGVLWASYAFRFQARPDSLKLTPSLDENVERLKSRVASRVILRLHRWKALPESYLYGLADVLIVSAGPRPTFLLGKIYPHGRWFYFPVAFVIKSTLGFLLLLALVPLSKALRLQKTRREVLFLVIPPVLYFALSLTSGLNIGVRHILPVYPFLIVLAAAGGVSLVKQNPRWVFVVAGLFGFHVISSLRSYPDYLAYSNEAWGGPKHTYEALADSNVDWGQGLKSAKAYLDSRHITDCWLAYFGSADPGYYQIPCKLLPDPFAPWWGMPVDVATPTYEGTVLVSATQAAGVYWGPAELNPYAQFLRKPPADVIGGSILVFNGRFHLEIASPWSRLRKAWELFGNQQLTQALSEARAAARVAPRMVYVHYTLGYLLAQAKQKDEARREYLIAISLAQTVYPEYQWYWVTYLDGLIKGL